MKKTLERSVLRMTEKLPVGVEFFEDFSEDNYYYIDKTMFIADLLKNGGKVNLFTRPRRFGKTLMMDTVKSFFEIGTDKTLFDDLKILQETELCDKYMGQFPVIFITLKSVDGLNFQSAYAALRYIIGSEASRFYFLRESNHLTEEDKNKFSLLITVNEKEMYPMEEDTLLTSLKTLSNLLYKHYGKKVILLIDEYDVPLDKAFQNGYYDKMVSLIRNLFANALKTNKDLYFAVITGCLRISKESTFTGLNNLKVNTVTSPKFGEYFGFTDSEVDELLKAYGLEAHKKDIRDWYDGYRFGQKSIYCPWDVINYCDELLTDPKMPPRDYWSNTSGNGLVKRFVYKADENTKEDIESLINGETVVKPIRQELTYNELDSSIDNLWSVLFSTGYLTTKGSAYGDELELVIPNKEITKLFIRLAKEWFQETSRADYSRIEKFCMAFPHGDAHTIQEMLTDYLWDSISVRDTTVRKSLKENFYHGMVLGLLRSRSNWLVKSNEEMGRGYSDITICTPEKIGVIIELKYQEDGNLEKGCKDALEQIGDRKYDESLKRRRMQKIIKYGIAFWQKECMVVMGDD